jgi:hypothetical protein
MALTALPGAIAKAENFSDAPGRVLVESGGTTVVVVCPGLIVVVAPRVVVVDDAVVVVVVRNVVVVVGAVVVVVVVVVVVLAGPVTVNWARADSTLPVASVQVASTVMVCGYPPDTSGAGAQNCWFNWPVPTVVTGPAVQL